MCAFIVAAMQVARAADASEPSRERGAKVYQHNCALCHGVRGRGDGRAARLYKPPPADLTRGERDDRYREAIIRQGGAALGRSSAMPAWNDVLTAEQIADLMVYLRSVRTPGAVVGRARS